MNVNNDSFSLTNCINNHKFNEYNINLFLKSQNFDESKIKCEKCKNNKYFYNNFYLLSNWKYICPCMLIHIKMILI